LSLRIKHILGQVAVEAYPQLADISLDRHLDLFKSKSFHEIQQLGSFDFVEAKDAGKAHENFIDVAKVIKHAHSPPHVRAFLFHTIGCNPLFAGNGKSLSETGEVTGDEFVMVNKRVAELEGALMIDIDVQIPS